ncbi:MAG: hypothetical protein ACPLVJ_01280 [Candidatus Bathyarchaeales archaeon]
MSNSLVAQALKEHGKWIRSTEFLELVKKKLDNCSEQWAYRQIKRAVNNGEILREQLPDGTVIYGLPEFGSFKTSKQGLLDNLAHKLGIPKEQLIELMKLSIIYGEDGDYV